jgi:hypothetical protein
MPPALFALVILEIGSHFFAQAILDHGSLWDEKRTHHCTQLLVQRDEICKLPNLYFFKISFIVFVHW